MAIRVDHGLGVPGYYDQFFGGGAHKKRLEATIQDMRRAWEEMSGNGFYHPDLEDMYANQYEDCQLVTDIPMLASEAPVGD